MTTKVVHIIDHMELPGPDGALAHLRARGVETRTVRPYLGEALPEMAPGDGMVVLGGVQMVTDKDRLDWMRAELDLMARAQAAGAPILGICLGGQMLADALGARVGPREDGRFAFGFHPVRALPAPDNPIPDGLMVLSGNEQGFEFPEGAEALATSDLFPSQAFRAGRAVGLQFHPEVTRPIFDEWQSAWADRYDLPGMATQAEQDADFQAHDPALKTWLRGLLDRIFALS